MLSWCHGTFSYVGFGLKQVDAGLPFTVSADCQLAFKGGNYGTFTVYPRDMDFDGPLAHEKAPWALIDALSNFKIIYEFWMIWRQGP